MTYFHTYSGWRGRLVFDFNFNRGIIESVRRGAVICGSACVSSGTLLCEPIQPAKWKVTVSGIELNYMVA